MSSRCSLGALASTPPLVFLFVFRPPAAWASDGPFLPFFSQWSPTFSKLCFTAAQATWLARRSSPYSLAAESCALAKVRWALAGERLSVPGSSLFFAVPLFVVLGMTSPFGSGLALPGSRRAHSRRSAHRGTHSEEVGQGDGTAQGRSAVSEDWRGPPWASSGVGGTVRSPGSARSPPAGAPPLPPPPVPLPPRGR